MAIVWLQVVVRDAERAALLAAAMERHSQAKAADYRREVLWRALVDNLDADRDGLLDEDEDTLAIAEISGPDPHGREARIAKGAPLPSEPW